MAGPGGHRPAGYPGLVDSATAGRSGTSWQEAGHAMAAGAILPLAGLIGEATGELAIHAGPRVGGLLNATFGNVTELVIAVILVVRNEDAVVKATITGS